MLEKLTAKNLLTEHAYKFDTRNIFGALYTVK